jgi:hypothetical protein
MNLINFIDKYPNEDACKGHFKLHREKEGVVCKKCKSTKHYWLKNKWTWQCIQCEFRTTLRSGTIMQASKLPFRKWYLAMAFMTFSKKGISAKEMQRQLGHIYYEPIWLMMHKLRQAMGQRDDLYKLEGMIEFDEAYVSVATPEEQQKALKRGRGSQKKGDVAVMAESTILEDLQTGKQERHVRYFKMKVMQNHKAEGVDSLLQESLAGKNIVFSDKSTSYVNIADYVDVHISVVSDKQATKNTLKWVHIAIANLKRNLLGVYHKIKGEFLQNYLNEFCYKLNRRYFGEKIFDRLVIASIYADWNVSR